MIYILQIVIKFWSSLVGGVCRLEEHLGPPPGESETFLEPECVLTFDLPFSMMAYEHLEVHSTAAYVAVFSWLPLHLLTSGI